MFTLKFLFKAPNFCEEVLSTYCLKTPIYLLCVTINFSYTSFQLFIW